MADVQVLLRSPQSYDLAARALEEMRRCKVWPTPTNLELWLHIVAEPDGPLAREIATLQSKGVPITEAKSGELAAKHLPQAALDLKLQDTSDHLDRQLQTIVQTLEAAQSSNESYGQTLAGATEELAKAGTPALKRLVERLTEATSRIEAQNSALETRLRASTDEVRSLQMHLEEVRRDSMTDALTSLPNRKALDEGMARAIRQADATNAPLTLAVVDIDHFKRFNDTWGHQTGDQVLRYVASVLARVGAAPRMAARYGGEEFAVLFPGEPVDLAVRVMEGARGEIGSRTLKRRSTNEDLGEVTVSAGVAQRQPGETVAALFARADAALYVSKRSGRNKVTNCEAAVSAAA